MTCNVPGAEVSENNAVRGLSPTLCPIALMARISVAVGLTAANTSHRYVRAFLEDGPMPTTELAERADRDDTVVDEKPRRASAGHAA